MRDAGDIDATRGDVGRDHHLVAAALEAGERLDALVLRAVGVEHGHAMVGRLQPARDLVGPVLGAGEYEHAVEIGLSQQRLEQIELLLIRHGIDRVIDGLVDRAVDAALDARRVAQRERGHGRDLGRHGGGEKEGLPVLGAAGDDVLHHGQEPHVEHPIDLVEHEDRDVVEPDFPGLEEIHEASGRRDDDVDAALQLGALHPVANTAEDSDGTDIRETREIAESGLDLRREFARGLKHEDARRLAAPGGAEAREDGQRESRGLARARLRGTNEVAAAKHDGNGAQLDGRRIGVAGGLHAAEDGIGKIKSFERHGESGSRKSKRTKPRRSLVPRN